MRVRGHGALLQVTVNCPPFTGDTTMYGSPPVTAIGSWLSSALPSTVSPVNAASVSAGSQLSVLGAPTTLSADERAAPVTAFVTVWVQPCVASLSVSVNFPDA